MVVCSLEMADENEKTISISGRAAYLDGDISLEIRADPTVACTFIFIY